jgi:hypothetical protein
MVEVSYDLDFQIFGTFSIVHQKCTIVGEIPEAKQIGKTFLQKMIFLKQVWLKKFLRCKH